MLTPRKNTTLTSGRQWAAVDDNGNMCELPYFNADLGVWTYRLMFPTRKATQAAIDAAMALLAV